MMDLCHRPRSDPSQTHCQPRPALSVVNTVRFQVVSLLQIIKFVKIPRPALLTTTLKASAWQQNQNVEVIPTQQ